MNIEHAERLFSESDILAYRGSYPDKIELTIISRNAMKNNTLPESNLSKLLSKLEYYKDSVEPAYIDNARYILKIKIGSKFDFGFILKTIYEIASDIYGNHYYRRNINFLIFLIREVIPFKAMQYDITKAFSLRTETQTPQVINYKMLMESFLVSCEEKNKINPESIGDCIISFIDDIFHVKDAVPYVNNVFTEYLRCVSYPYYAEVLAHILDKVDDSTIVNMVETSYMEESTVTLESSLDSYEDDGNTVLFEDEETIIDSTDKLIFLFGDNLFDEVNNQKIKEEIRHLNRDTIRNYLPENMSGNINFTINENFKMYLKEELQCKMMVSQIQRNDQIDEVTIISYEGDNFLLFTLDISPDEIYGISIDLGAPYQTRKLVTFYDNDDVKYQFIDNV